MLNQPVSKNKKEFFKLVALNYGRFFNKKNLKKGQPTNEEGNANSKCHGI